MARYANFEGAKFVNTDLQETKFYDANLGNAIFDGVSIRFTIFQNAVMDGCKGCPFEWQHGEKEWEQNPAKWEPAAPK
jgi:hypothetical protein